MKVFLDTTILIDITLGDRKAEDLVAKLAEEHQLCTSSINVYEFLRGAYLSKEGPEWLKTFEELAESLEILHFDPPAAKEAAGIYSSLRAKGKPVNETDYLIAGICSANGIRIIVTENGKHFQGISCFDRVFSY